MFNTLPLFTLIFIFSILGVIRLVLSFIKNLSMTPPKPFELNKLDLIVYGLFVSYIITYIIHI